MLADVERAMAIALEREPLVLAVSGGRDSMAMLDAALGVAPGRIAAVATFDHGTGPAASASAELVVRRAARGGVTVEVGRGSGASSESAWRRERWSFLRAVANRFGARVATAHTSDDQLETIALRVLRGAGARGLVALHAGDVVRPLLELSRGDLARYAHDRKVRWLDDPTNDDRAFARNRVRHELLPALLAARPALAGELLELSRRASQWRHEVEHFVRETLGVSADGDGLVRVPTQPLADLEPALTGTLWPAIAAMAGVVLDRRGTERLAAFTTSSRVGARVPLSGGATAWRQRDAFVVRRAGAPRWRVRPARSDESDVSSPWTAVLPGDQSVTVRAWRPGDRIHSPAIGTARRVKRFFKDAGVPAAERIGWPVVLVGNEIVWVPGLCRSDAATVRSGRPEARYVCERDDDEFGLAGC